MNVNDSISFSVVIPCLNESKHLRPIIKELKDLYPKAEVIVVDDGSIDDSPLIAEQCGAKVVSHPITLGNGAAIKSGARIARGNTIVFMDADGQHSPSLIGSLLDNIEQGYDMVVGTRNRVGQANIFRAIANTTYNWLSSKISGHKIMDLTSGFRAVKRKKFLEFLPLLPNGFSYPTTITMAFLRSGYTVAYVPTQVLGRSDKSHIKLFSDGLRFFLIIFRVGTLYSPLKIFFPISFFVFFIGITYYLYTFLSDGRFTNMSAILLLSSLIIFLIGLVSEQITSLIYTFLSRQE